MTNPLAPDDAHRFTLVAEEVDEQVGKILLNNPLLWDEKTGAVTPCGERHLRQLLVQITVLLRGYTDNMGISDA